MAARDPTGIYDFNTGELSEAYKRAVENALPTGVEPSEKFWIDLAEVVAGFFISEQNRASRRPPRAEIERFKRIVELATSPGKQHAELATIKSLAEAQLAAYQAIQRDFSRKKNAYNDGLYIQVLDLWCRGLGQMLGVSSVEKKVPGPLIKFFSACVNPLLAKPLTGNGIADIVDREKRRREKHKIWREKIRHGKDQP
jgi:hypothetical protein